MKENKKETLLKGLRLPAKSRSVARTWWAFSAEIGLGLLLKGAVRARGAAATLGLLRGCSCLKPAAEHFFPPQKNMFDSFKACVGPEGVLVSLSPAIWNSEVQMKNTLDRTSFSSADGGLQMSSSICRGNV